eukprot:969217-Amphidinium_carterae.1
MLRCIYGARSSGTLMNFGFIGDATLSGFERWYGAALLLRRIPLSSSFNDHSSPPTCEDLRTLRTLNFPPFVIEEIRFLGLHAVDNFDINRARGKQQDSCHHETMTFQSLAVPTLASGAIDAIFCCMSGTTLNSTPL